MASDNINRYFSRTLQDLATSAARDSGPPQRRPKRLRQVVVGLSILIVAFAVFAWPQGDAGGGGPLNAIAAAAEKTRHVPGGHATMEGIVTSPGEGPFSMTGLVTFDTETERSRVTLTVPRAESDGGPVKMEFVSDETVLYVRSSQLGALPDGSEWMAIDLTLGEELDAAVPAGADAMGELELLEAATGDVQTLGKENVRGVWTTHYRGVISVSEGAERLREEGAEDLAALAEEKGVPLRVEAWIDADELVRRMRIVKSEPPKEGKGPTTFDMRIDFFDFGAVPEIDVPESSEVFDATELTRDELGLSNDD